MNFLKKSLVGLVALAMAGCASGGPSNEQIGGLIGAAAGAAVGSQVGSGSGRDLAMIAGALLGYWAGSTVARRMTQQDRYYMGQTTDRALDTAPNQQTLAWRNPESGNSGTVTPTSTYRNSQGETCRGFTQTVTVEGQSDSASGAACQQNDGSWRVN